MIHRFWLAGFFLNFISATLINLWNANSGLEIKEICQNDDMNILILEGLQVIPITSSSKKPVTSYALTMRGMGSNWSTPFPHYHRFFTGKDKGAVYADFLDVCGMGDALRTCQKRGVKIVLQVKFESCTKFSRRKVILLSSLLWNSFLGDGQHYDRPFGPGIEFDGFHFVHDKTTVIATGKVIERLREMAWNVEKDFIMSTSTNNFKFNSDKIVPGSTFIIINDPKSIIVSVPFAVLAKGKDADSDLFKRYKNDALFYGTVKVSSKRDRFHALKRLLSRNPSQSENSSYVGMVVVLIAIVGSSILIGIVGFYLWRRKVYESKEKDDDDDNLTNEGDQEA